MIRKRAYGTGMWFWAVPTGMFYGGILMYFMKINDPRFWLEYWINVDERLQFNPEKRMHLYEDATMVRGGARKFVMENSSR